MGGMKDIYTRTAGWKGTDTSLQAAIAITPKLKDMHKRILNLLSYHPGGLTPDEAADKLGMTVLQIRPRFSELKSERYGERIKPNGLKRKNDSGKKAIVYVLNKPSPAQPRLFAILALLLVCGCSGAFGADGRYQYTGQPHNPYAHTDDDLFYASGGLN